ncbi:Unconventional myosin-VIIb [Phytophthora citrophthora]|uniref:Unconventional myosin-VIIb n=1 Tax=Phytophthora citrophthora TaxID=4793 RepID=A0AAD9LM39_9STRA|nr:Unconventional myosin-VIIb [Phytophthora citrophthora]
MRLGQLAGSMELVHNPEGWEADDDDDAESRVGSSAFESQAELISAVSLEQIPLSLEMTDDKHNNEYGDQIRNASDTQDYPMPFDQLPRLAPELLHPKKTFEEHKRKEKPVVLEPLPAVVFDVHPLLKYAQNHFNVVAPRASPFHKPVEFDLTKRLEWEKKLISIPLTRLSKEQAVIALQAFRNVSGFMGNRASGKNQIDHCFKLLRNVVPRPPALKDEIYCQLCKQLTRNPSRNAVLNGWLLLNACLVTFPPSLPLAECLERFISFHIEVEGDSETRSEVSVYASEALVSLQCCATKGERKEIPSAAELRALQRHTLNDIPVMLADRSVLVMQVSAWTTGIDLAGLVARKLGVCQEKAFALFELSDDDEEHLVPNNERIMDLYAEWERTHADVSELKQKKNKKKNENSTKERMEGYHLMYKAYLWVHVDDETATDVELYYLQAVHNVLRGAYVCDLDAAVELAGYQLYCKFGNDKAPTLTEITTIIQEYIPGGLLSASNRATIAGQALGSYDHFVNSWCVQSTQQARLAYLRLCKRQPFYGLTLFHVRNSRRIAALPVRVILAINDMGIGFLGADSDEVLARFPYADIASWGYSANSFVFIVVRGSEETEYSFKTVQGKSINDNVGAYVDYIVSLTSFTNE